jgi:integrase
MVGKRIRTSPILLDFQGVPGFVLIITYGHTYAVNAIRAGDDIKTVQSNMGHATAAFTLDKYGHFTERMKQDSAIRMESFMKDVLNL